MDFVPHPMHDFIDIEDFVDGLWTVALNAGNVVGKVMK